VLCAIAEDEAGNSQQSTTETVTGRSGPNSP
jgi:hypothetical protein